MKIGRRDFLRTVGAGLTLPLLNCTPAPQKSSSKPNIILCMADDQGWGDMTYNEHPVLKTPNFDAMAAEALRFDRFYASAPVCSPTRGSVMTGRHPNRFGCFKWGHTLRPQEITIAEALKTAGYVTGHFGKWHLGSVQEGSPVNPGASGFDEWFSAPNFFDNDAILSREGVAVQTHGESSMVTVAAAIDFIRKQANTYTPFFAVVWFGSPHLPHEALNEDRALYPGQPEKLQHFYGEVTAMDRAFGKLRQELRTLAIHQNTILWYCSDNGGLRDVGTTGGRGHKGQVYEGGLRVPAILEWPAAIQEPLATGLPCNTSDIYPTLLEITGVQMKKQPALDGISLVPLLQGRMQQRPEAMGFWDYPERGVRTPSKQWMTELLEEQTLSEGISDSSRLRLAAGIIDKVYPEDTFPGHAAWLDWPWKLHRIQKETEEITWELYDLAKDPDESKNVLSENKKTFESMQSELAEWQRSVMRSLNGRDY
jgi:arylsulfatase A-like enzyme